MIPDQFHRPLHDLRISVIDRCNFRCPYCMPQEQFNHAYKFLEKKEWLSFDEILRLVKIFVSLGVEKVRLTGGEPLLRPNLDVLVRGLCEIDGITDLALTTNASMLSEYAMKLKKAGLKRITISLDSLDENVFKALSGSKGHLHEVLAGIQAAKEVGFESIKLNSVIQRGINDQSVLDLVAFARQEGLILRFIEYMDVGNQNHWQLSQVVPSDEILAMISSAYPLKQIATTQEGETSEVFQFLDGKGDVGFVSAVSHPFCGTCNRLRLSADGKMYTCLFASQGTDLSQPIRGNFSDEQITNIITQVWHKRIDRYSQERFENQHIKSSTPKVEMYHIGG